MLTYRPAATPARSWARDIELLEPTKNSSLVGIILTFMWHFRSLFAVEVAFVAAEGAT